MGTWAKRRRARGIAELAYPWLDLRMSTIAIMTVIAALAMLGLTAVMTAASAAAQPSPPAPVGPSASPTPDAQAIMSDQQRRIDKLETVQALQINSLNASNDQYKFLLTGFAGLLAAVTIVGGATSGFLSITQSRREAARDAAQADSAQKVAAVMDVVQRTLESRLDAERQARNEAESLRKEVESLHVFFTRFGENLKRQRRTIEDRAFELAKIPRHDFRSIPDRLQHFAQLLDEFRILSEPLEEEPRPQFSARVRYIRGIAAHYSNEPALARTELQAVVSKAQPETDEPPDQYQSRVANAYYYLGVIESNFAEYDAALTSLDYATRGRPAGSRPDFLTRIVMAETNLMAEDFTTAGAIISANKAELDNMTGTAPVYLRLRSRLSLIEVNMMLLRRAAHGLEDADRLLQKIHQDSAEYYFATAALGQVHSKLDKADAVDLYHNAYATIQNSNDLVNVTEIRSQILLQMVAGLCCRNDPANMSMADYHLNVADNLVSKLPAIDSHVCTVFSTLSKRNEQSALIQDHIRRIRDGEVLPLS